MSNHDNKPKDIDSISGVETTGHEWDGLKELNNPAPRWWLWVFFVTVIWSIGYWVVYPAWPTISGHTQGSAGWTSHKKLAAEQAEIIAHRGVYAERIQKASIDQIQHDPDLYAFAVAGGKAAFKENCAACHGTGAQGGPGYPNLNDDDWVWGGKLADIEATIRHGVRSTHDETRTSQMPAFSSMLTQAQTAKLATHVLSLSGKSADDAEGAALFQQNCAACHGESGHGNREMGAPNLADAIWLYKGDRASIVRQIRHPRHGMMPNWEGRLPEETIKELTIYVHSLGGGEADAPKE